MAAEVAAVVEAVGEVAAAAVGAETEVTEEVVGFLEAA